MKITLKTECHNNGQKMAERNHQGWKGRRTSDLLV